MASSVAAICLAIAAGPAGAVSGGGLDYANLDITASPDFANGNFKGKDFTQGACMRACVRARVDLENRWY